MSIESFPEHKIASAEISVVIQGPLYREHEEGDLIVRCLASIREQLPQAEIIISTWSHQNTIGLDADKIIISEEPPCLVDINGNVNNILRQLVSTRRGIEAATRSFVLKFRADHALRSSDFTVVRDYHSTLPVSNRVFHRPITITNFFICNPLKVPILFHLSDLIQFGHREDLLDLWSMPLPEQKDFYITHHPRFRFIGHFLGYTSFSQVPEQSLMLGWLKKHNEEIRLPHICYTSYRLFKRWEQLLTDHFLMMNSEKAGIVFPMRFVQMANATHTNYLEKDMIDIRMSLSGKLYFARYLRLLLNKYITCWVKPRYLRSAASILLFSISPTFAKRIRAMYRSIRYL